jgi:AcrR family transcriptional regulator
MASKTTAGGSGAIAKRGPGRPRKLPFDVREELLLDAACAAFAARGYAGASLEEIAKVVGINRALVYEHFRTKEELFAATVVRERDQLVDFIAARYGRTVGEPLRVRVRGRFHAFLDYVASQPTGLRLLSLPETAGVLAAAGRGSAVADLARYLEVELEGAGLPHRELPLVLAAMLVGMANEVIHRSAGQPWDAEAVVDLLTDFTLAGLAGVGRDLLDRVDTPVPPADGSER